MIKYKLYIQKTLPGLFLLFFLALYGLNSMAQPNCLRCHSDIPNKTYMHAPIEDACNNCHKGSVNTHPRGAGREFKLAETMPNLCYTCHEKHTKKRKHAPAEAGECTMCHSPHSSENRHLLTAESVQELCFTCHDLEIDEKDRMHAPVEMGSCEECHDSHQSDFRGLLKDEKNSLCLNCHDNMQEAIDSKYPHVVVEDCSNCHDAHKSSNRNLLVEKMPDLCFMCHEPFDEKYGHVPVGEGECTTCHSIHGSENKKLLLERDPNALCLMCHDLGNERAKFVHAPAEGGMCLDCHTVHDSPNRGLLTTRKHLLCMNCHSSVEQNMVMIHQHVPFEDDCSNCHTSHNSENENLLVEEYNELCFMCHDNVQEEISGKQIVHQVIREKKSCSQCHSAHASNESGMLLVKEKKLCLDCHNQEYVSEFGVVQDIQQILNEKKYIHEPVKEGCTDCHSPHAEKYPYLLNEFYTPTMYAPSNTRNFQLCFNCHTEELMQLESGNLATNFRNGNHNLHYEHLKGQKARNCNLCHDMHAGDNEHLIKDKIQFGQWEMPLEFIPSKNGGSCLTGCHEKKEYRISSEVNNL